MNRNIDNHIAQLVGLVAVVMLTGYGWKPTAFGVVLVIVVGYDAYTTGWNDAVEERADERQ